MSISNCDLACEIRIKDGMRGVIEAKTEAFEKDGGTISSHIMGATKSGEAYVQRMTQASNRGKSTRYGKGGKS